LVVAGRRVFNLGPGPATKASFYDPSGVAVDAHGDLFIADQDNNVVEEVTPAGRLSVVAGNSNQGSPTPGPAVTSRLSARSAVAVDTSGDLFIADSGNNVVEEVTPAGRLSVVAGNGKVGPPTPGPADSSGILPSGVAVNAQGDLFITDWGSNVVEEVSPAGRLSVIAGDGKSGPPTPGRATSLKFFGPNGLAVNARGDLFIADWGDPQISDSGNDVVVEVTPAGLLSLVAGTSDIGRPTPGPADSSDLDYPGGVAVNAQGDLFITGAGPRTTASEWPASRPNGTCPSGTT